MIQQINSHFEDNTEDHIEVRTPQQNPMDRPKLANQATQLGPKFQFSIEPVIDKVLIHPNSGTKRSRQSPTRRKFMLRCRRGGRRVGSSEAPGGTSECPADWPSDEDHCGVYTSKHCLSGLLNWLSIRTRIHWVWRQNFSGFGGRFQWVGRNFGGFGENFVGLEEDFGGFGGILWVCRKILVGLERILWVWRKILVGLEEFCGFGGRFWWVWREFCGFAGRFWWVWRNLVGMATGGAREKRVMVGYVGLLLVGVLVVGAFWSAGAAPANFDVREHISSSTSYAAGKGIKYGDDEVESTPEGCVPVHINLVARHGTRRPTKKRVKELEDFADRLRVLSAEAAKIQKETTSLPPAWINDWKSPWSDKWIGGELLPKGEEELYDMAQRYKIKYPEIFSEQYHPDVYPIIATQVGRSSASSVAFGMGMFAGQGTLGSGKQRAFSVITDTKGNDIHLRFHDTCMAYKESKKLRKPKVAGWQSQVYELVAKAVQGRYRLALTAHDVTTLWLLCKNEASLLNIVDRACGLFTAEEIELLEWADDLEMHHLKGYGEKLNYRMGVPLLDDVVKSMDRAMAADQSKTLVEKARLRFAHAETIIPFSCLLGLFLEGTDITRVQSEMPLDAPLRPPQKRLWRGALVAPFAANTALVLHKCPADNGAGVKYLVQALHNEKPVMMPVSDHFIKMFLSCTVTTRF
ncbi:hypothetical protein M758_3G051300 [Ceratodon purpureus]|uniref:Multiple inositol polyphosphate phosphatase 1 n=1 Tax=Ceratodon purpureus TaxID=3225 RepID=A0A8T0IF58_CERPU|nr:hypothetical protein KC19_3G053200 [Ceratodon purpureus]KAG0582350.1 hypothetical protein KC19_3G053200 [Ceratodon purpureus]KAG0621826.1 hypothetical protein M758_3G051300 [Ceratodon purpureus]